MSYRELWRRLAKVYDEGEAKAIARMVYEVRYGLTLSDLLMGRDNEVPPQELEQIALRLEQQEPVQYVLGKAMFCNRSLMVNEHVLIPRPETEELCRWVSLPLPSPKGEGAKILDIGTGSGCIAITLAEMYPEAEVTAWDISAEALQVAEENARRTGVHVSFGLVDARHLTSDIGSLRHHRQQSTIYMQQRTYDDGTERAGLRAPHGSLRSRRRPTTLLPVYCDLWPDGTKGRWLAVFRDESALC